MTFNPFSYYTSNICPKITTSLISRRTIINHGIVIFALYPGELFELRTSCVRKLSGKYLCLNPPNNILYFFLTT